MLVRWLPLLALLLPAPALADSTAYPSLEGSWALEAGGTTIFRFDLARGEDGKWRGTWSKPSEFASDGNTFSRLSGPAKKATSMTALETPNGIELSFDDPTPGAVPDAGKGERAMQADLQLRNGRACRPWPLIAKDQRQKAVGCRHRPHRMGARRTDTDLEDVKDRKKHEVRLE